MKILASIVPAIAVAVLTFIAVLPWGTSQATHFFLPFLPFIAIHYWIIRRPQVMPVWFVFLCGLAMDALSNGPLGFWSLIYLIGFAMASLSRDTLMLRAAILRWIEFIICMALNAAAVWGLSSIYFAKVLDWQPLAFCVAGAGLVYPLIAVIFRPLNKVWSVRILGSLTRGPLTGRPLTRDPLAGRN